MAKGAKESNGSLTLVGLGLWDEKDISLKGMEACMRADRVYAEFYTANWGGSVKNLEKIIGKQITEIKRSGMEEESGKLLEEAREKGIVVLVPGDPLTATTHVHMVIDARKKKIPVRIVHSSSVYTAIARCGLGIYGFGRTSTVVRPQKGYEPRSFYDAIATNKKSGLHTLLLLDIGMSVDEGLEILKGIEDSEKKGLITPESEIIAASRLGSGEQKIAFGKVKDVIKKKMEAPAVIIIPGNIHFLEKEFLKGIVKFIKL